VVLKFGCYGPGGGEGEGRRRTGYGYGKVKSYGIRVALRLCRAQGRFLMMPVAERPPIALGRLTAEVQRIYEEAVDPVASRYVFERRPQVGEIQGPPTVLLLGNHSSGKSTFINHLLGHEIQRTGLAPTDDSFTILAHAPAEDVRDGEAVTSNPDLPYGGLRSFGPDLLSHLQMKLRPIPFLERITLIDSPGMIDTPGLAGKKDDRYGRGYDFGGVARWFVDHSDVVLVFFDPDKPGTTGETLEVFTEALRGSEHKLLIVLHKVDQCENVRDFARAYGALCWNLAKVIPRKDLPNIYTTYVPVDGGAKGPARIDFDKGTEELIEEVLRAPARRGDNALTRLSTHLERLRMHAAVASEARRDRRRKAVQLGASLAVVALIGIAACAGALWLEASWKVYVLLGIATVLSVMLGIPIAKGALRREEGRILAGLDAIFERIHAHELLERERAEDLRAHWRAVSPRLRKGMETLGFRAYPILRASERRRLDRALREEIPGLRSEMLREAPAARRENGAGVAGPAA
jgi:hypothetical protein